LFIQNNYVLLFVVKGDCKKDWMILVSLCKIGFFPFQNVKEFQIQPISLVDNGGWSLILNYPSKLHLSIVVIRNIEIEYGFLGVFLIYVFYLSFEFSLIWSTLVLSSNSTLNYQQTSFYTTFLNIYSIRKIKLVLETWEYSL